MKRESRWTMPLIALAVVVAIMLIVFAMGLTGCARIGSTWDQTPGRTGIVNPSPTTVGVTFDGGGSETASATGVGPGRYTVITPEEIRTLQSGSTPRDLYFALPDGSKLLLSSGTDIEAEGVVFNPKTGDLTISRFGTSASAPLRALTDLQRLATEYAAARDDASRRVIEAQMRTIEGVAPSLVELVLRGLGAP